MTAMHEMPVVAAWLKEHREEILKEWAARLTATGDHSAIFAMADVGVALEDYLNEIQSLAQLGKLEIPKPLRKAALFHSVRTEILALLLGEDAAARILRRHWVGSEEDTMLFRQKLSRLFREALRINSTSACDQCRWELNERLKSTEDLERKMKHACEHDKK